MAIPAPTPADGPLLEVRGLSVAYATRAGEVRAVTAFDLTVGQGEAVGLVGESGCGKSTVAGAIMCHVGGNGRICAGSIRLRGQELTRMRGEELRRLRGAEIAMVYQEPMSALNPSMTIGRQLMEVPLHHLPGCTRSMARARALKVLADVKLADPERMMSAYPHQLSGGQQQRAVIAMAMLANPSLLLLDEPTTALDVTVEASIVELIREIRQTTGTAVLYISHNLGLILQTCSRVAVMYAGQVVEEGPVRQVFDDPRHPYTQGLVGCVIAPGRNKASNPLKPIRGQVPLPHERPRGCRFGPRCDHFLAGRCDAGSVPMFDAAGSGAQRVRCLRWKEISREVEPTVVDSPPSREAQQVVLRSDGLKKYYPLYDRSILAVLSGRRVRWVKANEGLSFEARRGQTVAIVGESGCGKSTFARVLMGLETATSGRLLFDGADLAGLPVRRRSEAQLSALQMVFQNPDETLNPSRTVGAQIARTIRKLGGEKRRDRIAERVHHLLDLVQLPRGLAERRPRQLSGGQKQRIGIARAFAGQPAMVVCDEPVSALDVSVQAAVTGVLMDIQRRHGTTLLFISHDLPVVRYLADRIVVMYLGQVMEEGTADEVFAPPYHPYTEALLSAVPVVDTSVKRKRIILEGSLPSVLDPPGGCPFHTRCPRKLGRICEKERPPVRRTESGHLIRCHIPMDELRKVEPVIKSAIC